ncbi:diguanylate cyclase (GGDEF)-like protein/PAS domain S-box-containing protein [Silvibacterium bohemicum]|uniref:Diguanylate cyclase (GGDEF)-like protein/PAS domain S-box-containing protein n=1 Tax=Silvibacterium bohemicum TaxID=1577686 RepID=A0A841JUA5_9BACT|nr:EAL domain-containing protein [Silvibacterium bohemicum]MBB6144972.1 diguanylate cyclase (GGDEF)-like protein/PAS domain S-box-containing protein [Silvibacterium bohemicum]
MKLCGSFRLNLVALSVLLGIVASYTAFGFSDVLLISTGRRRALWLAGGASSMGFGIWAMHYLGMLAFDIPVPANYSAALAALSLLAAIFASGAALLSVIEQPGSIRHILGGAVLMGIGLSVMHYAGMAAMQMGAISSYDLRVEALSLAFAIAFSAIAIKIAIDIRKLSDNRVLVRAMAASIMGLGIATVHYSGMFAAHLTGSHAPLDFHWGAGISSLSDLGVAAAAALVLAAALISTSIDRYLTHEESLKAGILGELQEANAMRAAIVDSALLAIIATDRNGIIQSVNRAAERMLGYSASELVAKTSLTELHDPAEIEEQAIRLSVQLKYGIPADLEAITTPGGNDKIDEREWTYIRKDGTRIPVRLSVSPLQDESAGDLGFLVIAQDITAQKEAEHSVRHLALHDPLTGLPNRALLEEQIVRSLALAGRHKLQVALAVIDLDRFKHINDTLGRHAGDQILITLARRLSEAVRASDMVVRLGGDEFVILMPGIDHPRQSNEVMQRVLQGLSEAVVYEGQELYVTPSIGISAFPYDGHDLNTLLRKADRAMYKAKSRGRNSIAVFSNELEKEATSLLAMDSALRRAIKRNEFFLVYQPIFNVSTGRISGLEALIRWQQADGSVLLPAGFVPLAEETGLILKIGEWALRTACSQVGLFSRAAGIPLRMAVNISPVQFREATLIDAIREAVDSNDMAPHQLELEVTEGVLLDSSDEAEETITQIRKMGIQVAMDDFGTGYSSLGYLKRFPIDRLKIDRSFVTGMESTQNDLALTEAVIKMGHSVNAKVTAEGVETALQLKYLSKQGCDDAQGFYLAKPMRAEQLVEYLLTGSRRTAYPLAMPAPVAL